MHTCHCLQSGLAWRTAGTGYRNRRLRDGTCRAELPTFWVRRTADGTAEGALQTGYRWLSRNQAWDCMQLSPIFAGTFVWMRGHQGMQCRHAHCAGQHACASAADPDAVFIRGHLRSNRVRQSSSSSQQLTALNHFSRREYPIFMSTYLQGAGGCKLKDAGCRRVGDHCECQPGWRGSIRDPSKEQGLHGCGCRSGSMVCSKSTPAAPKNELDSTTSAVRATSGCSPGSAAGSTANMRLRPHRQTLPQHSRFGCLVAIRAGRAGAPKLGHPAHTGPVGASARGAVSCGPGE